MQQSHSAYSVVGLKRNTEQKWTAFENVTSLNKIAATLSDQSFDYAVIYDAGKKSKLGSWNKESGIRLYKSIR